MDVSQLSALQRLSLASQAKKSSGAGSLASFARKPGSKPTPVDSGSQVSERKIGSLVAIAASRRSGEGGKNVTTPTLRESTPQAKADPLSPNAKISKLAQKIKLGHSMSGNRTDITDMNSVGGAPQTLHLSQGLPGEVDDKDALFQAPLRSSIPVIRTTYCASLTGRANPSPFGSLLVAGWHTPVGKRSVPSICTAPSNIQFLFDSPSPDDIIEAKRVGTRLAKMAKEREGH